MATMQPPKKLLIRVLKPGTRCTPANILNLDNWVPIYHEPTPLRRDVFEAAKAVAQKKKDAAASKRKVTVPNTNDTAAAFVAEVQVNIKRDEALTVTKEPVAVVVAKYVEVVVINAEDTATVEKENGLAAAERQDSLVASVADVAVGLAKKDGVPFAYSNSEKNEVIVTEEEDYTVEDVQMVIEKKDDVVGTSAQATEAENAVAEEEIYEVETIVGHRMKKGALQYEIKWVGYSLMDNTFEPEDNLDGSKELLKAYKLAHSLAA